MWKRKNDEPDYEPTRPVERRTMIGLGAGLIVGLIVLMLLSVGTILWSLNDQPTATPDYSYRVSVTPYPTADYAVRPTGAANRLPSLLPAEAKFVLSTLDGEILSSNGVSGLRPTGLRGQDTTVAVDNRSVAYVRDGRLYIYQDGKERAVDTPGKVTMPAWGADTTALAYVVPSSD